MENEGVYTLKAMNMLGEIVTEMPFENDKAVDLQHLQAGTYFINVFESKQLKGITRIVIQN
jgi:hypothetical protein